MEAVEANVPLKVKAQCGKVNSTLSMMGDSIADLLFTDSEIVVADLGGCDPARKVKTQKGRAATRCRWYREWG